MTKDKAPSPRKFELFGKQLETWRRNKFRSAVEMRRSTGLSVPYSTYIEFERGINLPSVPQLLEIAKCVDVDATEAVLLWAKAQMPTEDLRAVFDRDAKSQSSVTAAGPAAPLPVKIDREWLFGKAEYEFILREEWFFEFCLKLILAYPQEVSFAELGLVRPKEQQGFLEKYLKPWLLLGRIESSATGIRAKECYITIPNAPEWAEIRAQNFMRAYAGLKNEITAEAIQRHEAFRGVSTRSLSPAQITEWVSKLAEVDEGFRTAAGAELPSDPQNLPYSLLIAFGRRKLVLPADLIARCGE